MASFTVVFNIEAATLDEAEALVAQWSVTPGTSLFALTGSVSSDLAPIDLPDGNVGDAFDAARDAAAASDEP